VQTEVIITVNTADLAVDQFMKSPCVAFGRGPKVLRQPVSLKTSWSDSGNSV
jgi:hypothetical protein